MNRIISRAAAGFAAAAAAAAAGAPVSAAPAPAVGAMASAARLACRASMTNSHPRDRTKVGVRVRTVAFARIRTVAHYKTVDREKRGTADAQGLRTIWYRISTATPGFRVVVNVYVSRRSRTGSCSTSFTPRK